jgi:hypothetical protein
MSSINRLATVSTLSSSDLVALFSAQLGNDAAATLATLLAWLQAQITDAGGFVTQYAAPLTGGNVLVAPPVAGGNVYLILTPAGTLASLTVTLPAKATCVDGQEVLVSCTQILTALTVAPNGAVAANGAPTSMTANGFFRMRYDGVVGTWYRVG